MAIKDIFKNNIHVEQAGNLSFGNMLGVPLAGEQTLDKIVPGVCVLDVLSTIGHNCTVNQNEENLLTVYPVENSTINVQIKNLFNYVRSKNSGSTNYEPVDMTMYYLYFMELISFIMHCQRLLQVSNTVSYYDKYKIDGHMQALGLGSSSAVSEFIIRKPELVSALNYAIDRINSFAKPVAFKGFAQVAQMFKGGFTDEEISKAQTYYFRQRIFRRWDGTSYETGTALIANYQNIDSTPWGNMDSILSTLSWLTAPLGMDQDLNIISGDILKTDLQLFHLAYVNSNATVEIVHDKSVLELIHNTTITRMPKFFYDTDGLNNVSSLNIVQSSDALIVQPIIAEHVAKEYVLDVMNDKIPPKEVVVNAAYLTNVGSQEVNLENPDVTGTYDKHYVIQYPGFHICTNMRVTTLSTSGSLEIQPVDVNSMHEDRVLPAIVALVNTLSILQLSKFNYAPKVMVYANFSTDGSIQFPISIGEVDNFENIDDKELQRIHEAIIAVMFTFN